MGSPGTVWGGDAHLEPGAWELSGPQDGGARGLGFGSDGDKLLVVSLASWGHPQSDGKTPVG